jgi:hypothetical protein
VSVIAVSPPLTFKSSFYKINSTQIDDHTAGMQYSNDFFSQKLCDKTVINYTYSTDINISYK